MQRMPGEVQQGLVKTVGRLAIELQSYVKSTKLSGQVLRNKTGTLRRSITYKVESTPGVVRGLVGTNIKYGRFWENGGTIPAKVRLVTQAFGHELKFPVYATWKERTVAPRSFLRSSLSDKADHIKQELEKSVVRSLKGQS